VDDARVATSGHALHHCATPVRDIRLVVISIASWVFGDQVVMCCFVFRGARSLTPWFSVLGVSLNMVTFFYNPSFLGFSYVLANYLEICIHAFHTTKENEHEEAKKKTMASSHSSLQSLPKTPTRTPRCVFSSVVRSFNFFTPA
jgi:hypothetical protein